MNMGKRKLAKTEPVPVVEAPKRGGSMAAYLVLTDVLLDGPLFFRLKKPSTTFGYSADCDVVLPNYSQLLNGTYEKPEPVDAEEPPKKRRRSTVVYDHEVQYEQWRREYFAKYPYWLRMDYHEEKKQWILLHATKYASGDVHYFLGKREGRLWDGGVPWDSINVGKSELEWRVLEDGDSFRLNIRRPYSFKVPGVLRFQFREVETGMKPTEEIEHPFGIMSLPNEILGEIASYLKVTEFLDTLALVSDELSARLVGEVKWANLKLDDSLDSLRIAKFASIQALRIFHPHFGLNDPISSKCIEEWRRLVQGENVEQLTVAISKKCVLDHIPVPSNVKKIVIKMTPSHGGTEVACMKKEFPRTVEALHLVPSPYAKDYLHFTKGAILERFSNIRKLELDGIVPQVFRDSVAQLFQRLTHYKGCKSCFEPNRFGPNLTELHLLHREVRLGFYEDEDETPKKQLPPVPPSLRTLSLHFYKSSKFLEQLLASSRGVLRNIRHFRAREETLSNLSKVVDSTKMPGLEHFEAYDCAYKLNFADVLAFLKQNSSLKYARFESSLGMPKTELPKEDFSAALGEGAHVHCKWSMENTTRKTARLSFFYWADKTKMSQEMKSPFYFN